MFNNLTNRFQKIFRTLTGQSRLTESNIKDSMEDIRTALLDADVNYAVANDFVQECSQACLGEEVLRNVKPGEQAVKVVYDKLVALLGEEAAPLALEGSPAIIMLCGLHGSGKTTTSAKLAKFIRDKTRKKVMLVGCDVYRPAAIDQIEMLANDLNVPVYADRAEKNVPMLAQRAIDKARQDGIDVVILDTAGRLQIDEELVQELVRVKNLVHPNEILLVGDGALGQEAVSVAEHFNHALGVTGIILTKMDGDSRGGAALSMRQVTKKPIKFLAVGERPTDLEMFHPDRMASRILGMGDILSLYEKAAETIREEEAREMEKRLLENTFGFDDFMKQLNNVRKMGGMASLLKLMPGMGSFAENMNGIDEKEIKSTEGMISSMTKEERRKPEIINHSRRIRIAKGCGRDVKDVNDLIKQFMQMRQVMSKLGKGGLGGLANMFSGGGLGSLFGGGLDGLMGNRKPNASEVADLMDMAGLGGSMPGMNSYVRNQSSSSASNAAKQKKRIEQKKQAKKQRQKNRRH